MRAKEENGTHPLAPTPEESLVQILEESDWPNALTYAKQNKYDDETINPESIKRTGFILTETTGRSSSATTVDEDRFGHTRVLPVAPEYD